MAEISYYDADLSDAIEKLNDLMGKVAKAPPGVRPEVVSSLRISTQTFVNVLAMFK